MSTSVLIILMVQTFIAGGCFGASLVINFWYYRRYHGKGKQHEDKRSDSDSD